MIIQIVHNGMRCMVEQDTETFDDLVELFKQCSVGVGFMQQTVDEYFDICADCSLVKEKEGYENEDRINEGFYS